MESLNRNPNKYKSKGDGINLRAELNGLLEEELKQSPEKIDTKKIDAIIELLSHLEGDRMTVQEIPKEEFANKYLKGNFKYKKKRTRYSKAAIFFTGLILCGSICNLISVRAANKSLFHFVKEKAYLFYFETVGTSTKGSDSREMTTQIRDVPEIIYESWEEMMEDRPIQILIPSYIPDGLEAMSVHVQGITEKDIGISRQYTDGEHYVIFLIRAMSGYGKMLYSEDKNAKLLEEKIVNGFEVFLYELNDKLQAVFEEDQFMYCIESNMDEAELIKIIEEMR